MVDQSVRSRFSGAAVVLIGVAFAGMHPRALQTAALAADSPPSTRDVINTYCVTCHNGRLKTAGLELDSLDLSDVTRHASQLEKIVTKLRTREMPPPGRPRPDAAAYNEVAAQFESALDAAEAADPHP